MGRYEGWWEERVILLQSDPAVYAIEVKLPELPRSLEFTSKSDVRTAALAGANQDWGPCQGVVEYTVAKHIPLMRVNAKRTPG